MRSGEKGAVLALAIIFMALTGLILPPSIRYVGAALAVSRVAEHRVESLYAAQSAAYAVYAHIRESGSIAFRDDYTLASPELTTPPSGDEREVNGYLASQITVKVEDPEHPDTDMTVFTEPYWPNYPTPQGYKVTCTVEETKFTLMAIAYRVPKVGGGWDMGIWNWSVA